MARIDDPYHFLDRAFEYYITGRFAALNNLQVAANLFHHAVEMLAKFRLLRGVQDDRLAEQVRKLKQKPYGHDLQTLWSDFKAVVGRSDLDRFDSIVADLNRWEDLRYGGYPVGIPTTMVFMRRCGPHETWSAEPQDEYVLVLEDVDELFTAMWLPPASTQPFWASGTGSSLPCTSGMRRATSTPWLTCLGSILQPGTDGATTSSL